MTSFTSPRLQSFRLPQLNDSLHLKGVFLFLFIPLVLFLFLKYPFGVPLSFLAAILIMIGHRFVAQPFFRKNCRLRCFWCGKTSKPRLELEVDSGSKVTLEFCEECLNSGKRFFDFTYRHRMLLRLGIFLPLAWYIVTMLLNYFGVFHFPPLWNRFIFQFFIAITVVTVSFVYRAGKSTEPSSFPFPIHNLFLLGAKNTLLVFRFVGLWWLAASVYILFS
jgi:hypothetical protein